MLQWSELKNQKFLPLKVIENYDLFQKFFIKFIDVVIYTSK